MVVKTVKQAQQAQIITTTPPCLTVSIKCVWFSSNVALCVTTKHLHFVLLCPKDIASEVFV